MSNQTRLFILVFLAFLPAVALFIHADRSLNEAAIESHEDEMMRLASRAGRDYRQILQDTESLLGALSEMTDFREPRSAQCNQALAAIMGYMHHYTAIQLIEPDGFVTCGSLAIDESLFVGDRYYHRAAMASGEFTVGEFVVGRLTSKPIVGLAHPVRVDDETRGVLAAYLDLDELANRVYSADVPEGVTLTVIDRHGRVMIRVPAGVSAMGTDTIGATVPETFPSPTGEIQEAYMVDGMDLDGVMKHFAVQSLEAGGQRASGHLLLGMTEAAMVATTEVAGTRQLQLLAVGAVFMFVLAWMFGHYTLLRDRPKEE